MSEIRDRVLLQLRILLSLRTDAILAYFERKIVEDELELFLDDIDNQILSIPEIAQGLEAVEKGFNIKVAG